MSTKKRMCAFGDSITMGIGVPDNCYSWTSIISKNYNYLSVINHGIGGQTSSDALKRIGNILKDKPDITTVQFGMNDHCIDEKGNFAVSQERFKDNMITIIESLTKINSKVILLTNHRVIEGDDNQYYFHRHPKKAYDKYGGANAIIEQYNEIVRNLSSEYCIDCIDMHEISINYNEYQFLRSLENSDMDDGVHPFILGARIYAQEIGRIINKYLDNMKTGG